MVLGELFLYGPVRFRHKKQLGVGSEKMMLWLKIPGFVTTNTAGKRSDFLPQGRLEISRRWLKSSVKTGNCSQTAVSPS